MKKLSLAIAITLSSVGLVGCNANGSLNHVKSETNTFGPAISKLQMLLPKDVDLKIDVSSRGWNNVDGITINKITAVPANTMRKHFCYSITSPNDTCEYGVQHLEPLPEKHFNSSLSLRHYTRLMSHLYNEKTRKWYYTSGFSRVNWPLWQKYKTDLLALSTLAEQYIALQKSTAHKLGKYNEVEQFTLPLEVGKAYSFEAIKALLVEESTVDAITQKIVSVNK